MKDKYKEIIGRWVRENFGDSEADDPGWNIDALAEELDKHFHEMYWEQELNYIKEDVENYAEEHGYNFLTEKQKWAIADKIRNSDWYCSIDGEDMEYYINQELVKEKK